MRGDVSNIPLCVDLDGTLTYADLSAESLLKAFRRAPWLLLMLPVWLLRGRHHLKAELAHRAELDVTVLPYNEDVLNLIRLARDNQRRVILVTGSNRKFADQIQTHLGLFDQVVASDSARNLTGIQKAAELNALFGEGAYEYVADGHVDLPVWESAGAAVTVNAPKSLVRRVIGLGKSHGAVTCNRRTAENWLKALRLHQWAKNSLLIVPLITSHRLGDPEALTAALIGFLSFGLCASATYIINDLFDLDSDRHHHQKKTRPFAAGALSVKSGLMGSAISLLGGISLALLLPIGFQLSLFAYLLLTLLYSLLLKNIASLDVLILAGLYTLRVIAGAFASDISLSFWLLAFSMFIFLCLGLVKRVTELIELTRQEQEGQRKVRKMRGREYTTQDIPILQILGASSGYLAVLVLALYINSAEVSLLYQTPEILWLIAPLLLLWVTRLWILTTRGYMDGDPILFAIKDPETWIMAAITAVILVSATRISF